MKSKSILLQSNSCKFLICSMLVVGMALCSTQSYSVGKLKGLHSVAVMPTDSSLTLKGVKMSGSDSSYYDQQNHLITFYGHAKLSYGNIGIEGDQITVDEISMKAYVKSSPDAQGHKTAHAFLQEGNQPALVANSLVFDLKNKKVLTSQR